MVQEKKKIIVTGASGTLGSALCKYLSEAYDVVPLYHKDIDIKERGKVISFITQEKPFCIVHAAAITDVEYCEENEEETIAVNVKGTQNLCVAAKDCGCKFIYISTDYVFNGRKDSPYTEEDLPDPISVYARSKLEAENIVRSKLTKYFIVRLSWLFGNRKKDFVGYVLGCAEGKEKLKIINDKYSTPCYNKDISFALRELVEKDDGFGVYHVQNGGSCSWCEWAKKILEYSGFSLDIEPTHLSEFNFNAKRPVNSVLNCDKFYKFSGFKLRSWQEALKEEIATCNKS